MLRGPPSILLPARAERCRAGRLDWLSEGMSHSYVIFETATTQERKQPIRGRPWSAGLVHASMGLPPVAQFIKKKAKHGNGTILIVLGFSFAAVAPCSWLHRGVSSYPRHSTLARLPRPHRRRGGPSQAEEAEGHQGRCASRVSIVPSQPECNIPWWVQGGSEIPVTVTSSFPADATPQEEAAAVPVAGPEPAAPAATNGGEHSVRPPPGNVSGIMSQQVRGGWWGRGAGQPRTWAPDTEANPQELSRSPMLHFPVALAPPLASSLPSSSDL